MTEQHYTERPVKGSGTGGQFNINSPKAQETVRWVLSQPAGTRLTRDGVHCAVPCANHVADGVLCQAREYGVLDGRIRTAAALTAAELTAAVNSAAAAREQAGGTSPADGAPVPSALDRRFVTVRRRQCAVIYPYQRDLLSPSWPVRKWGEFSLRKFSLSLDPVTVIRAGRVPGLDKPACQEHGAGCAYDTWPGDVEYLVLSGQHRTQEGGNVYGPDWEFQAAELLFDIELGHLGEPWWITEDSRDPGTREVFAKKVLDGVPAYAAMARVLRRNGFTYRRRDPGLRDFTSIGSLPSLWGQDMEAAATAVAVLGAAGTGTRKPLLRALFELAHWDIRENDGIRVSWDGAESMTARLMRMPRLTSAEAGDFSVDKLMPWQRVARYIAREYNLRRRNATRVSFPDF
jgi:hypothetical protein